MGIIRLLFHHVKHPLGGELGQLIAASLGSPVGGDGGIALVLVGLLRLSLSALTFLNCSASDSDEPPNFATLMPI